MTEIVPLFFKKYFNVMCMDVLQMDKKKKPSPHQLAQRMEEMWSSQEGRTASQSCVQPHPTLFS